MHDDESDDDDVFFSLLMAYSVTERYRLLTVDQINRVHKIQQGDRLKRLLTK